MTHNNPEHHRQRISFKRHMTEPDAQNIYHHNTDFIHVYRYYVYISDLWTLNNRVNVGLLNSINSTRSQTNDRTILMSILVTVD